MKRDSKQSREISKLFFFSKLKDSQPNLCLNTIYRESGDLFTIGTYQYDSTTGRHSVNPIEGYEELTYSEIKNKLS